MNDKPSTMTEESGCWRGYSPDNPQPLLEFAALLGIFGCSVATTLWALKKEKGQFPERLSLRELALLALATHKLSRVLSVDRITSPLRAPFTTLREFTGEGEVEEEPRGSGMRKVIGELVSCPYCAGVWTATALSLGRAFVPRLTSLLAGIFAMTTISNFLQHAYVATKRDD